MAPLASALANTTNISRLIKAMDFLIRLTWKRVFLPMLVSLFIAFCLSAATVVATVAATVAATVTVRLQRKYFS